MERGYNEQIIRKQILSTQEYSRIDLLGKKKTTGSWEKTNIQHHLLPTFSKCYEDNGGTAYIINS